MSSKIIEVRRKPNKTNLPDHLYEDSTRGVGATLGGSGEVFSGLTIKEIEKYMPLILGVSNTSQGFYKEVEDYFASLTVKIDGVGIRLEIGKDEKEDPINVQDFIKYKFIKANPKVADEKSAMGVIHQYYFYDPKEETIKKYEALQVRKDAEKEFLKIVSDKKKFELVLTIMDPIALSLPEQERELRLDALKENSPQEFLSVVKDKHLEARAFLEDCISKEALRRVGNIVLNGDQKIGDTIEGAILFLEDPKNSDVVATLKARVKTYK